MITLQDKQAPIDFEIVQALVSATPDSWYAATLDVARATDGIHEKLQVSISNPDGLTDLVAATGDLNDSLYRLSDLYFENGTPWRRVIYSIRMDNEGLWIFNATFEY